MTEFQIHNVMRVSDRALMLGQEVSLVAAIKWTSYYNSPAGQTYLRTHGYDDDEYVVVRLDIDLCEYLTIQ